MSDTEFIEHESDTASVGSEPEFKTVGTGAAAVIASSMALAACGSSGSNDTGSGSSLKESLKSTGVVGAAISAADASRFLSQAAFGGNDQAIAEVQSLGFAAWIDKQFAISGSQGHWDWLIANGYNAATDINSTAGIDNSLWRKIMSSPDVLRQRMALALSELFVVSLAGLPIQWRAFAAAAYMDLLTDNAFGNFRTLLEAVTLNPAMGVYLGTRGNQKEDPKTGRHADENYGREVMQLFTIGLYQLNNDGSQKLDTTGQPIPTYDLTTVTEVAKVFTGWNFDKPVQGTPDHLRRPMTFNAKLHSEDSKTFLGVTIPPNTDGVSDLKVTLDTLFNHPNVPPFIAKQLIQRFVTSNPSPAYVARVAGAFIGVAPAGVRGDLKAVLRAILLDPEARNAVGTSNLTEGKVREPMLRFAQWARTFKAVSTSGKWAIGDTSDATYRLGQAPMRSPTVFNFFRPGYTPAHNLLGSASLVAPELQITTESTVLAYANFMQGVVNGTFADLVPDYSAELAIASDPVALVNRLNSLLAATQLSTATIATIQSAVGTIKGDTSAGLLNRVKAAVFLVLCAPEYLVLK